MFRREATNYLTSGCTRSSPCALRIEVGPGDESDSAHQHYRHGMLIAVLFHKFSDDTIRIVVYRLGLRRRWATVSCGL